VAVVALCEQHPPVFASGMCGNTHSPPYRGAARSGKSMVKTHRVPGRSGTRMGRWVPDPAARGPRAGPRVAGDAVIPLTYHPVPDIAPWTASWYCRSVSTLAEFAATNYWHRLFFRFTSKPVKVIVYVWFNDEDTLRKAGSKTDVYEVFKRMLGRGQVPTSITDLLHESAQGTARQ